MPNNANPEQALIYLARLRGAIRHLHRDQQLKTEDYQRWVAQLDQADDASLSQLAPLELEQLLASPVIPPLSLDLMPLVAIQKKARVTTWIQRHHQTRRAGETTMAAGDLFPEQPNALLPITFFDWRAAQSRLKQLCDALKNGPDVDRIDTEARAFFEDVAPWRACTPAPLVKQSMIEAFLAATSLPQETQADLREALIVRDAGGPAFEAPPPQTTLAILSRRLPGQASLLRQWMQAQTWDGPERAQLAARLGMDPVAQADEINHALIEAMKGDEEGRSAFIATWAAASLPLRLLQVYVEESDPTRRERLQHALAAWRSLAGPKPIASDPLPLAAQSAIGGSGETEIIDPFFDQDKDELEDLEALRAPVRQRDIEDTVVETTSTWNLYLRPFLSENWLGLVGAVSLTAAWIFLSMWLWEKAVAFRVLAGTVPIAIATLSSAWITGFLAKREVHGTSPRATALLAAITFLMAPFYPLLSAGLTASSEAGNILGFGLGLGFLATLPFIGKRIAKPFGTAPVAYLLAASAIALVPGPCARWAPTFLEFVLQVLPIALTGLVTAAAKKSARAAPEDFGYNWMMHVGHALLSTALAMIFFRVPPQLEMLALLLPFIALALTTFREQAPTRLIAGATLGLLGNLIALSLQPEWLCLSLTLGGLAWFREARHAARPIAREIAALHLCLWIPALGNALGLTWPQAALLIIPGFFAGLALERRLQQGPLRLISLGLVGVPIPLTLLSLHQNTALFLYATPISLLFTWFWGHSRFQNTDEKGPWLCQQIMVPISLAALLITPLEAAYHPLLWPAAAALPALLWPLWSRWERAVWLPRQRALLRLLWLIPLTTALVWGLFQAPSFNLFGLICLVTAAATGAVTGFSAARQSQSPLPAWAAFAGCALVAEWLRRGLGLGPMGGLPPALAAAGLYGLAQAVRTTTFGKTAPTETFSFSLPWQATSWLPHTLLGAAGVLLLPATGRAFFYLGNLAETLPNLLALSLVCGVLYAAAHTERKPKLGYAAHAYTLALTLILLVYLPEYRGFVILACSALFQVGAGWVARRRDRFKTTLIPLLFPLAPTLATLTIPLIAGSVAHAWHGDLPAVLLLIAALFFFTHAFRDNRLHHLYDHTVLGLAFLFWVRLTTSDAWLAFFPWTAGPLLLPLFTLISFIAVLHFLRPISMRHPALCPANYRAALNLWRPAAPLIAAALLLSQPFVMVDTPLPLWSALWLWVLLWDDFRTPSGTPQLPERRIFREFFGFTRVLVLCFLGYRISNDPFIGFTLGPWLFAASEWMRHRVLQKQANQTPAPDPLLQDRVLRNLFPIMLGCHLWFWIVALQTSRAQPLALLPLYGLLPLVFLTADRLASRALFTLGLLGFAYANIAAAVQLQPIHFPNLSSGHLLTVALVMTLTALGLAARLLHKEARS
ncbi:hypothetical protein [Acanthopleuribacter pedis]|uniref:Uncharacterized protein n=1 Tax=Acanthopleuribacter pedis TaxID=442870 RepID=A0A8J7QAJ6_9BACT|nr:hypothetical protein [Acanthopleuribacter pedis]MBO1322867.1 hypothetical protein [Acanthopleuribacter pedis]